ncbi:MAG: manganese efflux pump MntP family protein [Longicatena sp.]
MNIWSLFLLGVGLSMDAFAVSIAKGMTLKKHEVLKYALLFGVFFGVFQAGMPLLGWWFGSYFQSLISSIDHWIAFILLGLIGFNMIRESLHPEKEESDSSSLTIKAITILAIATSIDALAVGISFAFLKVDILQAILIIGCTTFVFSFIATFIGNKLGDLLEKYAGILGGCILIFIGLKILLEHLFQI